MTKGLQPVEKMRETKTFSCLRCIHRLSEAFTLLLCTFVTHYFLYVFAIIVAFYGRNPFYTTPHVELSHFYRKRRKDVCMSTENTTKKASSGGLFGGGRKSSRGKADNGHDVDNDIKKLTRTELLELLIDETKEADRLRAENERLSSELQKCHEDLDRVASFEAVIARLQAIVNGR